MHISLERIFVWLFLHIFAPRIHKPTYINGKNRPSQEWAYFWHRLAFRYHHVPNSQVFWWIGNIACAETINSDRLMLMKALADIQKAKTLESVKAIVIRHRHLVGTDDQ